MAPMRLLPLLGLAFVACGNAAHGAALTLKNASQLALENDLVYAQMVEQNRALVKQAVAEGSWPDPTLKVGFVGLPESRKFDEIDMTQKVLGLKQKLPSWGLVGHKRERARAMADGFAQGAKDRRLKVIRDVRMVWMDIYYFHHALRLIAQSKSLFQQLAKITEYQYRSGRRPQYDVMRARLELSLLRDREMQMEQSRAVHLASLNRWLGKAEGPTELDMSLPRLPNIPAIKGVEEALSAHPSVKQRLADLKAAQEAVKIERSKYVPGWSIDLTYGEREGERSDLMSAVIMLDLPLLPGRRQGKMVAANRARLFSAQHAVDDKHREFVEMLNREHAKWRNLSDRLGHYQKTVMPVAAQNAEASLKAYQNGITDFTVVVRARLLELESGLKELRLRVDQTKSHAGLLYVAGDNTL